MRQFEFEVFSCPCSVPLRRAARQTGFLIDILSLWRMRRVLHRLLVTCYIIGRVFKPDIGRAPALVRENSTPELLAVRCSGRHCSLHGLAKLLYDIIIKTTRAAFFACHLY